MMVPNEFHNVDSNTDKLTRTPTAARHQEEVHSAHPPGRAARRVVQCLRWLVENLAVLFMLRFGLKMLGVDPHNSFAAFLYTLTSFFLYPFAAIAPSTDLGVHVIEWSTLIAMAVYALLFSLLNLLLRTIISRPRGPNNHRNEPNRKEGRDIHTDEIVRSRAAIGALRPSLVNQHLGDYTLTKLIGQGGFAHVYLGIHRHLQACAALKLLDLSLANHQELRRFQREAHILARLSHPHIVRALGSGYEGGIPFIVMEYAPWGTLHDYFTSVQPLPLRTILPFVAQVAGALGYLHQRGIVHCDVKPENILLGPQRQALLADFGTAQYSAAAGSKVLEVNELVGTPMYVAPEHLNGAPLPASDQYSLAVVVYHWLCHRPPFLGTPLRICLQHIDTPPPPLRDLVPSLSPAVERVVLKALAKDPGQRFANVQMFAYALAQASQAERGNTLTGSATQPRQFRGLT
jgi:hypothetical protein